MPTPSPEARARSNEKAEGGGTYIKNGKKYFSIHLYHPCGGCWQTLNKENSYGNGYCNECMKYMNEDNLDMPHPNWSDDMKKFYNQQKYLDRNYFEITDRTLFPHYKKLFKIT